MIELRTGVPGAGKTLSMVSKLAALFKRWETHPEEARPVFIHNIKGLKFPVSAMPLVQYQRKSSEPVRWVPDWAAMPDGSLVLIDECQGNHEPNKDGQIELLFPPRSSSSEAPPHVSWLNTHRHHGIDIWLTTQNPKLIDITVRALVGKHQHYRRLFGGNRAMIYEWDACSDNLSGMKTAVIAYFSFPKKSYEWYKSAEIHTKQSFRLPRWLLIPVIGLVLGALFIPKAYTVLSNGMSGKGLSKSSSPVLESKAPVSLPATAAKGGAVAPPVAPVAPVAIDYNKPLDAQIEHVERSVADMKISSGVYSDDDSLSPHFSRTELSTQKINSELLDAKIAYVHDRAIASIEFAVPQIIYNERPKVGALAFD